MRRALRYGVAVLCLLLAGAGIALYFYGKSLAPRARERFIAAIQDRFDADVDLTSLNVSLYPRPEAVANGLTIRHKGWSDPHPLIYVRHLSVATDFLTLIGPGNRVSSVRLEGLEIHIPARGRSTLSQGVQLNHPIASAEPGNDTTRLRFRIESIVADGATLEIDSKAEGKPPLRFQFQKLSFHSVGPGEPMSFKAELTNAKPPGIIESSGHFGPWQRDDPRATPVSGNYTFQNANLAVFKGIAGILSSKGSYHGVLQHIEVDGATDTPDFALKRGGKPVDLHTTFHAIVNGADGDTILDPVDAGFMHSEFVCTGSVVHDPGSRGKTVALDAVSKHARVEDIWRLVVGNQATGLIGAVEFKTKILIPPGQEDVLDKLKLDGQFSIRSGKFTGSQVQQRLETLSARARGISKEEQEQDPVEIVASDMRGAFKLNGGVASFSNFSFEVPGALLHLAGNYKLRSEEIDMSGTFQMRAKLSETQSGVKHLLLKPLDPLFEKNGAGFTIPIKISGTKDHPEIGTELFHHAITIH